jgi:hypothetical protein
LNFSSSLESPFLERLSFPYRELLLPHHNTVMDGFFGLAFGILALLGPFGLALIKAGMAQSKNSVYHMAKPMLQLCTCKQKEILLVWADEH